jgi:hypothetical protein
MKFWLGALLASLAWILVDLEAATADCSSHYTPTISLATNSAINPGAPGLIGERTGTDPAPNPGGPRPCTGSMCSGRPALPVSPAPTSTLRIGFWAILELGSAVASPEPADSLPFAGRICPTWCAASVFHPPRLAASHLTS